MWPLLILLLLHILESSVVMLATSHSLTAWLKAAAPLNAACITQHKSITHSWACWWCHTLLTWTTEIPNSCSMGALKMSAEPRLQQTAVHQHQHTITCGPYWYFSLHILEVRVITLATSHSPTAWLKAEP